MHLALGAGALEGRAAHGRGLLGRRDGTLPLAAGSEAVVGRAEQRAAERLGAPGALAAGTGGLWQRQRPWAVEPLGRRPEVVTCGTAISAAGAARWRTACAVCRGMRCRAVRANVVSLNAVLSALPWRRGAQAMCSLQGLRPDVIGCNAVIGSCQDVLGSMLLFSPSEGLNSSLGAAKMGAFGT